ncbi:unnamed protein product [Alopecurus aequalis]
MWSLLLSSLRPVRRRASQPTAVLGSNNLVGSRGFASRETGDTTKQHLYVVLVDHEDGFGVHKLDLDDHDDDLDGGVRRLPEPPVLRVALTTLGLGERVQFAAVGSSIVGIGSTVVDALPISSYLPTDIGSVLIYDTKTAVLTVTSQLPNGLLDGGYKAAIAIGKCLYMLGCALPSIFNFQKPSLHREPLSSKWKWTHRGEWHLPVIGHAHYDGHLDAWVGLHAVNDGSMKTDGHLCVANVRSAPPEWKVGKEKLFHLDGDVAAGWKHVDTKLVPITSGEGHNKYCLVERLRPEGEGERTVGVTEARLTCFHVELGQEGEPMATAFRPARSYEVSLHNSHFEAQAFWM